MEGMWPQWSEPLDLTERLLLLLEEDWSQILAIKGTYSMIFHITAHATFR
jgi:hypothetical protein